VALISVRFRSKSSITPVLLTPRIWLHSVSLRLCLKASWCLSGLHEQCSRLAEASAQGMNADVQEDKLGRGVTKFPDVLITVYQYGCGREKSGGGAR